MNLEENMESLKFYFILALSLLLITVTPSFAFENLMKIGANSVARSTLKSQGVNPDSREGRLIRTIAVEGMFGDSSKSFSAMHEIASDSYGTSKNRSSGSAVLKRSSSLSAKEIAITQAKKGNLEAILYIANCTYKGVAGFNQDYKKAYNYFKQAESLGNNYATGVVGMMLYQGTGTKADKVKGFSKLKKAAEANDQLAQQNLIVYYMTKENTNFKKALYWAGKQIRQDDPESVALCNAVKSNLNKYGTAYSNLVFQEHSFKIDFEEFGKAKFEIVSNERFGGPYYKLLRYRLNNGDLLYYLPVSWDGPYSHKLRAVAFKDLNNDGLKDICILSEVLLSRFQEIKTWNENGIWFATKNGHFVTYSELNEDLTKYNTFSEIRNYMKSINSNSYSASDWEFGTLVDPHDVITLN